MGVRLSARATVAVCATLVLGSCGAGESAVPATSGSSAASPAGTASASGTPAASPASVPAPRTLTPSDDGGSFTMGLGSTSELVVRAPGAGDPVVDGASVLLVPVVNITDSGVREWEVRAVAPGRTTVRSVDPDYSFTITVS